MRKKVPILFLPSYLSGGFTRTESDTYFLPSDPGGGFTRTEIALSDLSGGFTRKNMSPKRGMLGSVSP